MPPPPPPPPPLPPLVPLPPLTPDFVAATSEAELRSLIEGADDDVSVYLAPGTHISLRLGDSYDSRIKCTSNIKVTVASSGEGATLDGQGGPPDRLGGLFSLEGGCSLTLRGLNLVNGRTQGFGGVVDARDAGDIEIVDSTVADCSAYYVSIVAICRPTAEIGTATAASLRSLLATAERRRRLR